MSKDGKQPKAAKPQEGYWEMVLPDLAGDLMVDIGRLLDEALNGRQVELEQIVIGVAYRDEIGEGTAWKPLHGNRWTSALGLIRAMQRNLDNTLS